ncbi:integrase, catalytic region, zinc finger, CCHC-type containing protein [Tanacetum coccineum]
MLDIMVELLRVLCSEKDTGNVQRNLRATFFGNVTNVQCYNCNKKGHYACNCPKPRVWDSKYFMEQRLLAKKDEVGVILTNEQNDFLLADTVQMEELEELSANICMMERIQPATIDYDEVPNYDSAFISEFINDKDKIIALEKERDELQLSVSAYKKQIFELQDTQSALKRKMNDDKNKYLNNILNMEAKVEDNENVVIKIKHENIKLEYQKFFDSIKKTRAQTQGEIDELVENMNQKTYAYADIRAQNQDLLITISELKSMLKTVEKGLKDATSVRRPSSRGSSSKNSVLLNTKEKLEDVVVHVRINKKTNVASKKDVMQTKNIVTKVDVKNALKAKDVLCVSCAKNVLILCDDSCLAKYKLSMYSNVRRTLFTTPRTAKPKTLDSTPESTKTRFALVSPISTEIKDSFAIRSTTFLKKTSSLSI